MGSETTAEVMDAISNIPPSGLRIIGSYDAGQFPVQTKIPIAGSDCVIEPVGGSRRGVQALVAQRLLASNPPRRPCLDFARSTDASSIAEFSGAGLTWVPFANDKVTYVTRRDSALPSTLTTAQLKSIYECTARGR